MIARLVNRAVSLLATLGLLACIAFGASVLGFSVPSPFSLERIDNSQPPVLKSIQKLSKYHAAQGSFQVVVDLENGLEHLPGWLVGRHAIFVGAGSVDAYVDLGSLGEGAVTVSADTTSAQIVLSAPQLDEGNLDINSGNFVVDDSGWLDRLKDYWLGNADPDFKLEVLQRAEEMIGEAAAETALTTRAEENTRSMLEGFLKALGYETVTVTFDAVSSDGSTANRTGLLTPPGRARGHPRHSAACRPCGPAEDRRGRGTVRAATPTARRFVRANDGPRASRHGATRDVATGCACKPGPKVVV